MIIQFILKNLGTFSSQNITILSLVIGIIGVALTAIGIILTIKATKVPKPKYTIQSKSIRESDFKNSKIEITSEGKKIPRITISKFCFWNAGNDSLYKKDIAEKNPIRINVKDDAEILDSLIYYSQPANDVIITKDKQNHNSIELTFDYLAKKKGLVLKIFHTGEESEGIQVNGSLKKGKKIKELDAIPRPNKIINWINHVYTQSIILSIISLSLLLGSFLWPKTFGIRNNEHLLFFILLIIAISSMLVIKHHYLPKELDKHMFDNQ